MRVLLATVSLGFVLGCAGTAPKMKESVHQTASLEKPAVTLASGYQFAKTVDGVMISVTPTPFEELQLVKREMQEKPSTFLINDLVKWEITDTPVYVCRPTFLEFSVKVTNNLDHVLRLAGAVVTVSVDGKPFPASGVEDMERIVLVPGQSWEGVLNGPQCGVLPDDANLVFSVYDVVTAVDAANNPTKRTNFEWVFTYATESLTKDIEVKRYEQNMTREQAAEFVKGDNVFVPGS
jgi:hypothetical protein